MESLEQAGDEPLTYKRRRCIPRYRYEYSDWQEVARTPNLVPVEWGQQSPYNDQAPLIDKEHALTGCVATAAAQLISSFKYPASYKGTSFDWGLLTKYPYYYDYRYTSEEREIYAKQVASLLRKIGDKLGNKWDLKVQVLILKTFQAF